MEYWRRKHRGLSQDTLWSIDWESAGAALQQCTSTKLVYVLKTITGHSAVGKNMKRRKVRQHSECPRCGASNEDEVHVIRCKHQAAIQLWHQQMKSLTQWLRSNQTDERITYTIITNLRRWGAEDPPEHSTAPRLHLLCHQAQTSIGWDAFMQGKLSLEWADQQTLYFQSLGLRRTGKRWVIELIKKLWNVSWTMWDHRNNVLHSNDSHAVLGSLELRQQIEREFLMGPLLLPSEFRYMLQVTEEEVRAFGIKKQRRWLEALQAARRLGLHRRKVHDPTQRTLDMMWT